MLTVLRATHFNSRCRWEPNSYGFLGEDGKKWHNFEGYEYGSPHQSGDVIGAGIHLERQEIFFT